MVIKAYWQNILRTSVEDVNVALQTIPTMTITETAREREKERQRLVEGGERG